MTYTRRVNGRSSPRRAIALVVFGGPVLVGAMSLGCSKSSDPSNNESDASVDALPVGAACTPGAGESTTQTIGLAGGSISFQDLQLTIPVGALLEDTPITVTSVSSCPALGDDFVSLSRMYEIDPAGITLAEPATIDLAYPGLQGAYLFVMNDAGDFVVRGQALAGGRVAGNVRSFTLATVGMLAPRPSVTLRAAPASIDFDGTSNLVLDIPGEPEATCTIGALGAIALFPYLRADGSKALFGTLAVTPTTPTTYTATCTGSVATSTAQVQLAAVVDFQVRPAALAAGETVTINWTGRPQIASCELIESTGNVHTTSLPGTNTVTRKPAKSTTYTLLCFDMKNRLIARKQVPVVVSVSSSDAGADASSDASDVSDGG